MFLSLYSTVSLNNLVLKAKDIYPHRETFNLKSYQEEEEKKPGADQ